MPSSREYPWLLEQAWLRHAMAVTGARHARQAVERLESAAGSLSDAFTTGRDPGFAGYASDPRALAAYGLFFFPRAFARTAIVLDECQASFDRRPVRVVDLGAGTGAAGLACLHAWSGHAHIELELVDRSREGLTLASQIFDAGRALWANDTLKTSVADARNHVRREADVIISSFAINEWMEGEPSDATLFEWVNTCVRSLAPGGRMIILEPALRFTVERMERLRDRIAEAGSATILAPCPHHRPCPMLAGKRGWCHEVRTWRVPESLHWINRKLQRDIHLLKFSMLVLENTPAGSDRPAWMRIVSPVAKEKGKCVFFGCGHDGGIHACEWLSRNLSDEQKQASENLERGDRVVWNAGRVLGDGTTERGDGPPARAS